MGKGRGWGGGEKGGKVGGVLEMEERGEVFEGVLCVVEIGFELG